jgi:hypothetical protein
MNDLSPADDYFRGQFNTELDPEQTKAYAQWIAQQTAKTGRNIAFDDIDYDLRGAFKEFGPENVFSGANGHGSDKYKKPNHSTFSDQSMYHGSPNGLGGKYIGGKWEELGDKRFRYTPSQEMLDTTHDAENMRSYFRDYEKGNELNIPLGPRDILNQVPSQDVRLLQPQQ